MFLRRDIMDKTMHTSSKAIALAAGALLVLTVCGVSVADPTIDGKFDPGEGYTDGWFVSFAVERSVATVTGGQLWTHQAANGDLSIWFGMPKTLVDNTYGANSIGWGDDAPSGKNHNFKDLVGSDDLQVVITDDEGEVILDVTVDYISETGKGTGVYYNKGVLDEDEGDEDDVLAVSSSLVYNFNVLGHQLTQDSPATDDNYTENPQYAGWIFDVAYELKISGDAFDDDGFGAVDIPLAHVSPNKIGKNKVYPDPGDPVPEPMTLAVLSIGGVLFACRRRRKSA